LKKNNNMGIEFDKKPTFAPRLNYLKIIASGYNEKLKQRLSASSTENALQGQPNFIQKSFRK